LWGAVDEKIWKNSATKEAGQTGNAADQHLSLKITNTKPKESEMKKLSQHIAFIVSFLAGFRLLVEQLTFSELIEEKGLAASGMEILARVALAPLPLPNFLILVVSLSALGILCVPKRTTRCPVKQRPLPPTPRRESMHEAQYPASLPHTRDHQTITEERIDEEWHTLEDADKEAIREIIVQGGLWESDIIALLQVRGLRSRQTRGESLADRISFVQCDHTGYYSIRQDYHILLENILAKEYAEEAR
jgi:hypothetical protein